MGVKCIIINEMYGLYASTNLTIPKHSPEVEFPLPIEPHRYDNVSLQTLRRIEESLANSGNRCLSVSYNSTPSPTASTTFSILSMIKTQTKSSILGRYCMSFLVKAFPCSMFMKKESIKHIINSGLRLCSPSFQHSPHTCSRPSHTLVRSCFHNMSLDFVLYAPSLYLQGEIESQAELAILPPFRP